jgi:hypothetical protein
MPVTWLVLSRTAQFPPLWVFQNVRCSQFMEVFSETCQEGGYVVKMLFSNPCPHSWSYPLGLLVGCGDMNVAKQVRKDTG